MPDLRLFARLTKVDEAKQLVYGTLVAEEVDKAGEIFDYASSKPNVEAWSADFEKKTDGKSFGNLRAMHGDVVAGVFKSVVCDDASKSVQVIAHVVDGNEWKKVQTGSYTGFSIGGSYAKKWPDGEHTRYTAKLAEGSLVDNGCGPSATFSMIKVDGSTEMRKFHPAPAVETPAPEPTPELEQVWKAKDGSTYATKALAKAHNDEADAKAAAATPASKLAAELAGLKGDVAKLDGAPAETTPIAKARVLKMTKVAGAKPELVKGLYTVGRLAELIQSLDYLAESCEYEAASEGDGSTVPASLKASVSTLCASLVAMVEEETRELLGTPSEDGITLLEMAERPRGLDALVKLLGDKAPAALAKVGMRHGKADAEHLAAAHDNIKAMGIGKCAGMAEGASAEKVAKSGARHSKADAQHLQDAHDSLTKAGAPCPAKDAPETDEEKTEKIAKAAGSDLAKALEAEKTKTAALEKTMTDTTAAITELRATVAKFSKMPLPRPHERVVTVVTKGDEPDGGDLTAILAKMSPDERDEALKQIAISLPRQFTR
jgi:hypothetical protein